MDIKIKDFEGPLDLLLHLVSKYQMDIYDVPIAEVIEQYLAYIRTLQAMKLEVAGEYMLMASQLTLIKSRKLIPKVVEQTPIEEDPEHDLLTQIEEYRQFKVLSEKMGAQHQVRSQFFAKPKTDLVEEDVELARDKTRMDIFLAFSQVMANRRAFLKTSQTTIARDEYKIEDMMTYVRTKLQQTKRLSLGQLFETTRDMNEMITIFLATLELIKVQELQVTQQENFGEIILVRKLDEQVS